MLKIWKMAADFQNVYRCNVCLCSSVVLAGVLEHNCNSPKRITFCGRYLCFSFTFQPASAWATSWEKMWMLIASVSLTKCGCCSSLKEEIFAFSKKKKTISKSSYKTSSTRGSSDAMFLVDMICTQTPAHWHPKIPIKWYGSIYFVSLVEKKCPIFCALSAY